TTATTNDGGPIRVIDAAGAGAAESTPVGGISLTTPGTYYVAVSSHGTTYNANTGTGATGGTSTGAYSIQVTYNDLPVTIDDTFIAPNDPGNLDNSSFGTATVLGVVGSAGQTIAGAKIGPSPD